MKLIITFFIFLNTTMAVADETIEFNLETQTIECQGPCTTPLLKGQPITLNLKPYNSNSKLLMGNYIIKHFYNEIEINIILQVMKSTETSNPGYYFTINYNEYTNDLPSDYLDLGTVFVNDVKQLNLVNFKHFISYQGKPVAVVVALGPKILIGAP